MVKKGLIFIVFISGMFTFHFTQAQTIDTIPCDTYFRVMENTPPLMTLWSRLPVLKEPNMQNLCELCDWVSEYSSKYLVATLIVDKEGNTICVRTYSEMINDSLNSQIVDLLFTMKFEPATGESGQSLVSYYPLILNAQKCDIYKKMVGQKRKARKKSFHNDK